MLPKKQMFEPLIVTKTSELCKAHAIIFKWKSIGLTVREEILPMQPLRQKLNPFLMVRAIYSNYRE